MPPVTYTAESEGPSTRRAGSEYVMSVQDEYSHLTKAELEQLLQNRDLPKTGNKDELIARLQEND